MTNHFMKNKPFHDKHTSHRAHDRDGTTTPLSHDRPVAALPEVHLQRLRGPALNAGALNAAPLNASTSTTADVAEYRTRRHAANSSAAAPAAAAPAAAASVEAPAPDTGQEYDAEEDSDSEDEDDEQGVVRDCLPENAVVGGVRTAIDVWLTSTHYQSAAHAKLADPDSRLDR